jgi:hypothetical protein
VASANVVLENTGTGPNGDMTKVFGQGSPEWNEAVASNAAPAGTAARALAQTDFVGFAIHCGKGGGLCAGNAGARPDLLPDEPGGYQGFQGLFGAASTNPVISPGGPLTDLDGRPVTDPAGNPGFPGFDGMSASVTLGYVAAMQEHGIPVTFGYISDAHDLHTPDPASDTIKGQAQGPGEAGYVRQLRDDDRAFATFFERLARDGITPHNTLFVVTVDEGDHFVGGQPANPGCDGTTTPCQWSHVVCAADCPADALGEVNVNLRGLLATERGNTTPFDVHADMAPAFYLHGNPARDAAVTRTFERDVAALTATSPYTGRTGPVSHRLVDRVGLAALHMRTGDPLRTPTFVDFLDPDDFGYAGAPDCSAPCVEVQPGFAWNHGGIAPEIADTWVGLVGPGVRRLGQTGRVWSDHTDLRPTMLALLGLRDDYLHDGRVLTELVERDALPPALAAGGDLARRLGAVYKQIDAPFGALGRAAIAVSDAAVRGDDATYRRLEAALAGLTADRDALAAAIRRALEAAAFEGRPLDRDQARRLIRRGEALLARARALAT